MMVILLIVVTFGLALSLLTEPEAAAQAFASEDWLAEIRFGHSEGTDAAVALIPGMGCEKELTVEAVGANSYMRLAVEFLENDPDSEHYNERITDKKRISKIKRVFYCDPGFVRLPVSESYSWEDLEASQVQLFNGADFKRDKTCGSIGMEYYNYKSIFTETTTVLFFTSVIIPEDWSEEDIKTLGECKVMITAQTIHASGFDNADDAFAALRKDVRSGGKAYKSKAIVLTRERTQVIHGRNSAQ